jgi:cytoskeletal protein CcmA (bactofilin family)
VDTIGKNLQLIGELRAEGDLTVEGRIDGPVICEEGAVVVSAAAQVRGDILARDITVFGTVAGQLVATEVVDVRAAATVTGRVVARRFILDPAAHFDGRVEPQHLDAAVRVARFERQKRDGLSPR